MKFLVSKSMNITNVGVEKMLRELQKEYDEIYQEPPVEVPRKRGRPKKKKAPPANFVKVETDPQKSMLAQLQFALVQ